MKLGLIVPCYNVSNVIKVVIEDLNRVSETFCEILFIDNSNENIQAAKDCGWQTYLYDSCNYEASNVKLSELVISLQV